MLDALLFAVRDSIRASGLGYGYPQCELTDTDGRPPPRMGNIFVAVHELESRSNSTRNLDEYFTFALTLTMRMPNVPLDRVGDQVLASKLARKSGKGSPSFNSRCEQLRALCHMNWQFTVLTGQTPASANDNVSEWSYTTPVYGFVEPAHYTNMDRPALVGGEWFTAEPEAQDVGLKAQLRFSDARRMQPQTSSVGPFV